MTNTFVDTATQSQSVIIDIDQSAIQRASHPQIRFLSLPPPPLLLNTVVHPTTAYTLDIRLALY